MEKMPTDEELRERYRAVMDNENVTALSTWTMGNADGAFDDQEYLDRSKEHFPALHDKLERVIDSIGKPS